MEITICSGLPAILDNTSNAHAEMPLLIYDFTAQEMRRGWVGANGQIRVPAGEWSGHNFYIGGSYPFGAEVEVE